MTGGSVVGARRLTPGSNIGWRVKVEPSVRGDVAILLPVRACTETNAVCVGGEALAAGASITVPGPDTYTAEPAPETLGPITANWVQKPEEHDGSAAFDLHLDFSHEPVAGFSHRSIAGGVVSVRGGGITRVWRWVHGRNRHWGVQVTPSGTGVVTASVNGTGQCGEAHAVCDAAGRKLKAGADVRIEGPAMFSVADAEVEEAVGATLDFLVSLSRARSESTTVDYATSDGTARAGDDYTATFGTLTFEANVTTKTISVPVLDDPLDEGNETLTLTLSNPNGARLDDATATGTITNTDPIPRAWIARFGRTAAEQVLDAVEGRMRAARRPEAEVSLGGARIGLGPVFGARRDAPAVDGDAEARAAEEAERAAASLTDWLKGATDPENQGFGFGSGAGPAGRSRTMGQRELLLGSSFSLTEETAGKGFVSLWGRGAVTRFDGREGSLALDGEVTSAMLGTDWRHGRWTTGLVVAHNLGEGGYRDGGDGAGSGTIEATLTGLYPWLRHALSDRLEAWGAAGYGAGSLTLEPGDEPAIRTDLDLWMAAAGLRGTIVDGGGEGLTLTGKTDATIVQTSTDAVSGSGAGGGLAAAEAEVTRLRLGLEGSLLVRLAEGSVLTPGFEFMVRHDGGDAETGFGADIGASLAWTDPKRGLSAELRGRGLLAHEAEGFRERGLSGAFAWEPAVGGRGPRLSLTQTVGGASSGGAEALFGRGTLEGLAANDNGDDLRSRRLELRFGYGFAAFGDRFTWTPEAGVGLSHVGRDYSLGWRLVRRTGPGDIGSLELSFEARRRESANGDAPPSHEAGCRLQARF